VGAGPSFVEGGGAAAVPLASGDSRKAVERLIETETEAIDALKGVIPPSGNEGRSQALEHLILRKQNQVDFLLRALRRA